MERTSLALPVLVTFWMAYAIVAAVALYGALPPLNLELLLILGGVGAILAVLTAVLCRASSADRV